jgi:hypothetical protein
MANFTLPSAPFEGAASIQNFTGGINDLLRVVNEATGGYFGPAIFYLFIAMVLLYTLGRGSEFIEATMITGFLGVLIGVPAAYLGIVGDWTPIIMIAIFATSGAFLYMRQRE